MHTITVADIARYIQTTGDFKPFIRKHSEYRRQVEEALDPQTAHNHPTVSSLSAFRGRLHFRPGEITVWAGWNGHRKSMFLGQVVADLLVQKKPVLICSMEMAPEATLSRMARQMSGKEKPSPEWLDRWFAWTDRLWLFDYQGRIDPATLMGACRWFASEVVCPHVVIDSMMMVCGSEEHLDEQKQFTTDLVRFAQEAGAHVHLVAHCRKPSNTDGESKPPSKYDLRGSASISDQAHNVVTVWSNRARLDTIETGVMDAKLLNEPDAIIRVEKQRNGKWEGWAGLWFDEASMQFCGDRVSPVKPYNIGGPNEH